MFALCRSYPTTFADLLKLDSSLDLRQRAPNGLQGDLSIRGGGFGQTLILLDGLRLNDVQSGHHNLDIPAPLEAISSIEILKGSGSTLYGSDAVGGVVNFITRAPESSEMRLRTAARQLRNQPAACRPFLRGEPVERTTHLFPRFFHRLHSQSRLSQPVARVAHIADDRLWGRQRSRLQTTIALSEPSSSTETSIRGNGPGRGSPLRGSPSAARPMRRSHTGVTPTSLSYIATGRPFSRIAMPLKATRSSVRRRENLGENTKLFYGFEMYRDSIVSNNLGAHDRTRAAPYVALDVRALRRFSFSIGLRDEIYGSFNHELSPSIAAGFWLAPAFKLRGSVSRAFRLPTYTDLYYHDPANVGSPNLRPERAWSYEGGLDWNAGGRLRASVTVFQRRERDGIDYVRSAPTDIWRATNFQRLAFHRRRSGSCFATCRIAGN